MTNQKQISAEVIADSINPIGNRLTTFVVTFPRIILAELNTHRMFSRNSASSRAIPFERMLKMVEEDPFIPIAWQKDHKGMQGTTYFTAEDGKVKLYDGGFYSKLDKLKSQYLIGRDWAVQEAKALSDLGLTKQLVNRGLEPYMWHTAIITATEWENFFHLRCPQYESKDANIFHRSWKDAIDDANAGRTTGLMLDYSTDWVTKLQFNRGQAEIHMMALAEAMWDSRNESKPKELDHNGWHIPFGDGIQLPPTIPIPEGYNLEEGVNLRKVQVATARCARVSYLNFEGKNDYTADIKLHDQLLSSGHISPFEHCAKAMPVDVWSGNFRGFKQYRKMIPGENKV